MNKTDIVANGYNQTRFMRKLIRSEIRDVENRLGSGQVDDWDQFIKLRGIIEGLQIVLGLYDSNIMTETDEDRKFYD